MPTKVKFTGIMSLRTDIDHKRFLEHVAEIIEKIEQVGSSTSPEYVRVNSIKELD